jgi:hypothetical protein
MRRILLMGLVVTGSDLAMTWSRLDQKPAGLEGQIGARLLVPAPAGSSAGDKPCRRRTFHAASKGGAT